MESGDGFQGRSCFKEAATTVSRSRVEAQLTQLRNRETSFAYATTTKEDRSS